MRNWIILGLAMVTVVFMALPAAAQGPAPGCDNPCMTEPSDTPQADRSGAEKPTAQQQQTDADKSTRK